MTQLTQLETPYLTRILSQAIGSERLEKAFNRSVL
jgi:hypothetical protein